MPTTSKKQHNFMAAVAHSPEFAKKAGVPQSVGRDFNEADKGRKYAKGGETMATMNPKMAAIMAAKRAQQGGGPAAMGGAPMGGGMAPPGMKKGGRVNPMDGDTGDRFADGEKSERKVGSSRGPGGMMLAKGGPAKDGAPRYAPVDGKNYAKGGKIEEREGYSKEKKGPDVKGFTKAHNKDGVNPKFERGVPDKVGTETKGEKRFAKGGYVRDADGIAARGKTRGKFI